MHDDGYGARFEDFADAGTVAALGYKAAHLVVNGFEDGETGVDDAEESFEGGEQGDESVERLCVGGNYRGCAVDPVKSDGADA